MLNKSKLLEGVHLTLPLHIFSVQASYIKGQWGQVQNKIKETSPQP